MFSLSSTWLWYINSVAVVIFFLLKTFSLLFAGISLLKTKKRVWCVLEESKSQLVYYRNEEDVHTGKSPLGSLSLIGAAISLDLDNNNQFIILWVGLSDLSDPPQILFIHYYKFLILCKSLILWFCRFVSNCVFEMAEFESILVLKWIFMYFMCIHVYVACFKLVHLLQS